MHFSFALLISAPLSVLAGPTRDDVRSVNKVPDWFKSWNGRCTSTKYATRTVTSTRKTTRYPRPTTTTICVVSTVKSTTTLPQVTNVFSTTSTLYTTTTATESATETDTVTETLTNNVSPPTSSIPAPRELEARTKGQGYPVHPGDLKCKTTIHKTVTRQTVTRYVTSTSVARRQTVTKKTTKTRTTTISVLPTPASKTSSFSTTATVGSTVTNTQTQTVTSTTTIDQVSGPAATVYAACGPDNILDSYNGRYIDILYIGPPGDAVYLGSVASAYDCCVACINTAGCAGAGYIGGPCYGLTADATCRGDLASGQFGTSSATDNGWRVSNSGCGQWGYAGN